MSTIRSATTNDLPRIVELVRQSFGAMAEHYGNPERRETWEFGVAAAIREDLNNENFLNAYFQAQGNHFWVIELEGVGIAGCVGLKRKSNEEMELVRMAVDDSIRGQGLGGLLLRHLLQHCKVHKVCRVLLVTGNPQSKQFYEKNGFVTYKTWTHTLSTAEDGDLDMTVFNMTYYVGAKIIRRVGLTGGTHGNELLGIELVKRWLQTQGREGRDELRRSTMQCVPVLANLPAIALCRRYVDKDLNRQFKLEALQKTVRMVSGEACGDGEQAGPIQAEAEAEAEDYCAAQLNSLLGPKSQFHTQPTAADFIIDMHSSTSHLGNMLILGCLTHDNLAAHAAHAAQQRLAPRGAEALANGVLRVASPDVTKEASHWLDSLVPSGLAIEVGPLAHGTMNASLLEDTRRIVLALLDFLEERNVALLSEAQTTAASALSALSPSSPTASATDLELCEDARGFDASTATYVPRSLVPTSVVPAVVAAAAAMGSGGPELDYFHMVHPLLFPKSDAGNGRIGGEDGGSGEAAEAAGWASLPAAVAAKLAAAREVVLNTPARGAILHASMDGKDWTPLEEGRPLFLPLDGVSPAELFNRAAHCPSERDSGAALFPVFVNEAAYQESNTACWIVKEAKHTLY